MKPHIVNSAEPDLENNPAERRSDQERHAKRGVWEPSTSKQARATSPVVIPIEQALVEVIRRPIGGEGHRVGNDRKEREIAELFETLTPIQSLTLNRRLASPSSGDLLATTFQRLVVERRTRLLDYLARRRVMAITRSS